MTVSLFFNFLIKNIFFFLVFLWKDVMMPGNPLGGSGDLLGSGKRITA